jgi:tripartite-type tricarboxylate transporter receptor subunit TctC
MGNKNVFFSAFVSVFMGLSILTSTAVAQEYPVKSITLIVGYAAGGTTDLSARKLAELAKKYLNDQPVVVEDKVGGAGTVAAVALSGAAPDGYTIGTIAYSPTVLIPHVRKVSYNTKKDFEYLMQYAEYPEIFCVLKDHPANTWKEWLAWAKKNVDKASYTSSGPGSGQHVFMQEIFQIEKINPPHIPFGGGSEAAVQVLGGHVNAILAAETVPHIKSGQLKPLAVENAERLSFLPNVPTFKELGYPNVRGPLWLGMAAPAKTPPRILRKLEDAFTKTAKEPAFQEMMKTIEMINVVRDSGSFRKIVEADYDYLRIPMKSPPIPKQTGTHSGTNRQSEKSERSDAGNFVHSLGFSELQVHRSLFGFSD